MEASDHHLYVFFLPSQCSHSNANVEGVEAISSRVANTCLPSQVEGELTFNQVQLNYPSRPSVKVLDDFTATFPKGKVTALVGSSGSGKSSIIGLLERFYSKCVGPCTYEKSVLRCKFRRSCGWPDLPG